MLRVSYSAFICIETLIINSRRSILAIKRENPNAKTALTLTAPGGSLILYPLFVLQHLSDTVFTQILCVCFPERSTRRLLPVWSAALQSCTIKSVQPRAFFAGHMTKSVRRRGRESEPENREILRATCSDYGREKQKGERKTTFS